MSLSQEDLEKIAESVRQRLHDERTVDVETHKKHHDYIDTLIMEHEKTMARKEKWLQIAGGWGIVTALTVFTAAVWNYVKDNMHQ